MEAGHREGGWTPNWTPGPEIAESTAPRSPTRTADVQGKLRWRGWESNPRHHDFQSWALPTELPRRDCVTGTRRGRLATEARGADCIRAMKWLRRAAGLAVLLVVGAAAASGGAATDSARLRYLPDANALRTVSRFGGERIVTVTSLGMANAARPDPRWLAAARPLGEGAPSWRRGCTSGRCSSCTGPAPAHRGRRRRGARAGPTAAHGMRAPWPCPRLGGLPR